MELEHDVHKHTLILNEEHESDGAEIFCNACERPVIDPYYSCSNGCEFFLHKLCAELPQEVNHCLHPGHRLRLYYQPNRCEHNRCSACRGIVQGYAYLCRSSFCYFRVDADCALMEYRVQQRTKEIYHKHPLIPLQKRALFLCDACGREHRDASFLCTTCGFWVSQKCASLPRSVQHSDHHHPLTLVYFHQSRYSNFWPNCKICHKEVNVSYWVYCCANCKYFAHVYCASLKKTEELPSDCETEDEFEYPEPNPIRLPFAHEYVDLTAYFIKEISLRQGTNKKAKEFSLHQVTNKKAKEINHESHYHPLNFFDNTQMNDESSSGSKNDITTICNGCIQPVLAPPYYGCCECNFFLHECCEELPNTLDSACHPEHKLDNVHTKLRYAIGEYDLFRCHGCQTDCNGFGFGCLKCKFIFDLKCASLPRAMTHKAHTHDLELRKTSSDVRCNACISTFSGLAFVCDHCNFILHARCALLPGTVRHRYDEHPFALTYSSIEGTNEYYCEIFEEEMDAKAWFYHCVDCDQSLHAKCIRPIEKYSNIKFGTKLLFENGSRSCKMYATLTFVRHPNDDPLCDACGEPFDDDRAAVECNISNFRLHLECARGALHYLSMSTVPV